MYFHDELGLVHLISALLSVLLGTVILAARKGTLLHKTVGYAYVLSMLTVNITAFFMYHLFGGFGIFHVAALVSLITLLCGIIPAIRKSPKNWRVYHFIWMYWSVLGLYAAFASELLTRIPKTPFFGMVGIATGAIMLIGAIGFRINKKKWLKAYGG